MNRLPDHRAIIGRHVDLEAEFAGEADTEQTRGNAADVSLAHAHMRHRVGREIDILHMRRNHLAAQRALHRNHRPLLGHRGQPDAKLREFGLSIVFHVMQHAGGATGGCCDVEAISGPDVQ